MKLSATKIIRIAALVLCAAILVTAFAGDVFASSGNVFVGPGVDLNAAMNTFPPDEPMVYSGNLAITWDMFYFFLFDTASQVTYGFMEETDWHESGPTGETLSDLVIGYSTEQAIQALVYEYAISLMGVTLSDEELENIDSYITSMLAQAGSFEALEEDSRANGFFGVDGFEKLMRNLSLQAKLPFVLYGDTYSDISDDVVESYAQREGYMLAKHILLTTISGEYDQPPQEVEALKEAAYSEATALLEELNAHKNDANFVNFFSGLELQHSEDPGSRDFPGGYLFQYGDMVPEFSDACAALGIGEMSGIVESSFGYHIILRLPLDYDNIVPFAQYSQGQNTTLRQLAVLDDFESKYFQWRDAMDIEFSPDLESLDLAELFAWQE